MSAAFGRVALTFDDGPHLYNTGRLLDIALEKQVRVTFFVLGERVERNANLLQRLVEEGHEIGNHTWSHANLAKLCDDEIASELIRTENVIKETAIIRPKIMRPPYGELTLEQRRWISRDLGYKIVLWTVDPRDWSERYPELVADRIIKGVQPGSIILAHDIHASTVDAMPRVFDVLTARGFRFVTVSELLEKSLPGVSKDAP
jgi:peptidoglycan/xylan/chitin deacetylase (PgdA/CDA1 family)